MDVHGLLFVFCLNCTFGRQDWEAKVNIISLYSQLWRSYNLNGARFVGILAELDSILFVKARVIAQQESRWLLVLRQADDLGGEIFLAILR